MKLLTIALFFILPGFLGAQPLDTLIGIALANNLEMQALYQEYQAQLERAPQVGELPDPEVGIGLSILPVETRLGPQWVRMGVTQMFPWSGTLQGRQEVELAVARTKFERTEVLKLDLAYQVKQAYYRLYELEASRRIVERNLRLFRSLEQLALTRVESGQASTADVLRVQLRIREQEQQLRILDNLRTKPLATLNQNLNRPLDTPVDIVDTLEMATLAFDRDTLAGYIQGNHPMLRLLSRQQEVSRKAIELNAIGNRPSFGLGVDYFLTGKRTDADPLNNGRDALAVRGSIRLPLFTKKYAAKEQEEKLKIQALENQKQDLETKYLASVEQAFTDWRDAGLRIELYNVQKRTVNAAVEVLTSRYSTQGQGFDELLRLILEKTGYDLQLLQAVVAGHLAKAEIEKLIDL